MSGSPTAPVPVLPSRLRRPALLLLAGVVGLVGVLGVGVSGASAPGPFDQRVDVWLRNAFHTGPRALLLDALVSPAPVSVMLALLVAACLLARRGRLALVAAVGPLGSYVVTSALKPVVGRTIHGSDNLSYPSGHAAYATAFGLVLGLLVLGRLRTRPRVLGALLLVPGLALGAGMAVDQVVLDAHYPTDTLGGIGIGTAVVVATALLVDEVLDRRARSGSARARTVTRRAAEEPSTVAVGAEAGAGPT